MLHMVFYTYLSEISCPECGKKVDSKDGGWITVEGDNPFEMTWKTYCKACHEKHYGKPKKTILEGVNYMDYTEDVDYLEKQKAERRLYSV